MLSILLFLIPYTENPYTQTAVHDNLKGLFIILFSLTPTLWYFNLIIRFANTHPRVTPEDTFPLLTSSFVFPFAGILLPLGSILIITITTVYIHNKHKAEGAHQRNRAHREEEQRRIREAEELVNQELTQRITTDGHIYIGRQFRASPPLFYSYQKHTDITLEPTERFSHCYIIGKTGSGKSTLLSNMIAQDMNQKNRGVIVLAAESDLFQKLLHLLPPTRQDDLIY